MDVSFTNVLEGARQYFQGLPAGSSSTSGAAYSNTQDGHHDQERNIQIPQSSSGYWPTQHDSSRPPPREHTPNQRPASHHSDTSRPPSHQSQVAYSSSQEATRTTGHNTYQTSYQDQSQHHQSFQFPRPQSREAPSNASQSQTHQHYQSHIAQASVHHPPSSPQQPRVPSRPSEQNVTPPASQPYSSTNAPSSQSYHPTSLQTYPSAASTVQSYHQMQTQHGYQNYQQGRSFYPAHSPSQTKGQIASGHAEKAPSTSQHYGAASQEGLYYKSEYSYAPLSQTSARVPNQYNMNHIVTHSQTTQQEAKYNYTTNTVVQTGAVTKGYSATHNLPPIASLSSVNYLSNRNNRDVHRSNSGSSSRSRTSSGSSNPAASSSMNLAPTNAEDSSFVRTNTSIHHQVSDVLPIPQPSSAVQTNYSSSTAYVNQNRTGYSQPRSSSATTITQSYNHTVNTTSSISLYNPSLQQQSSGNRSSYYHPTKTLITPQPVQTTRIQPSVIASQQLPNTQPEVLAHVDLTEGTSTSASSTSVIKHKRESPLDLSVKTVRTSADSTHEDMEHDARQKSAVNYSRTAHSISTSAYSTYDISNSFQRSLTQRPISAQISTASAPKVDFLPDFSLSHSTTQRRTALPTTASEKPNPNQKFPYEKVDHHHLAQQYSTSNRYPTASVPSAAHVNSYTHSQPPLKRPSDKHQHERQDSLPRIEFPGNSYKAPSAYIPPTHELHRKRTAATSSSVIPNKVAKIDNWKQTIDQEIEQRFSTYKQQQEQRHSVQNPNLTRSTAINGYTPHSEKKPSKDMYGSYQRADHATGPPPFNMYANVNQYHSPTNHTQTYVPTVPGPHYPNYSAYTSQNQQPQNIHSQHQAQLPKTNSNSSLHHLAAKNNNMKNPVGGAANKHVLSLLRNSLEIKGAKEAKRKLEQEQSQQLLNKVASEHLNVRTDVQQPSTDVTAPLQPKPGLIVRQNVSPFTPTNFPETNYNAMPTPYKLHLPRAVDSVNFDTDTQNTGSSTDKQNEDHHIMANHNASNSSSDLDGLAAFLAARIRTKAELKQVGPSQPFNSANQNTYNSNVSQLHSIIENQLKTPIKEELTSSENATPNSTNSSVSVSPPKLTKEKQMYSPRRRLFSRNEDEQGCIAKAPPRDTSGLRSSSETSIFDFPDSESDGEMPILERQSLEDMRRDRKSGAKSASLEIKTEEQSITPSPVRPPSPDDDIFDEACNNFMEQLKTNVGKKRGRRKKCLDQDVLAMLEETVTKEKPLEDLRVKVEVDDSVLSDTEATSNEILISNIKTEVLEVPTESPETLQEDSDTPLSNLRNIHTLDTKSSVKDGKSEAENIRRDENKSPSINIEGENLPESEIKQEIKPSSPTLKSTIEICGATSENTSNNKPNDQSKKTEVPLVIRPAKKPTFGDGSDFYPGWEEEVCKYKKSLRMPPSLIQTGRPPQSHRLSTSLPDLDRPHPYSPSDSNEFSSTKSKFTKIKSEPIDSESESNSSFNFYSTKSNYDSEGSSSVISLPNTVSKEKESSFLNKLFERYGGHKKRKHKKKEEGPKIIPKSDSDLLPTPSLEIKTNNDNPKKGEAVIASESALLGFRTKTIETFKETFIKAKKIVGVNEHLTTVVLNTRTRKETKVLKQRATIKEVFGEDRPASAPPDTCVNEVKIKQEADLGDKSNVTNATSGDSSKFENQSNDSCDPKQILKNRILNKDRKRTTNLYKTLVDKKIKTEFKEEPEEVKVDSDIIKRDPDTKSETPSIDGDDNSGVPTKKKSKFRNIRRKCSSGFDYIRKKKRQSKKDNLENDPSLKPKKRITVTKASPESVQDIQKEIKSWVLNKGIGETHLHRAARLGYTDVTVYCLEKMECSPSPKDNAGYTPLHEACSRGHLDIAKLLLAYGANPSESAQGGIRPLHEAVENGFVEVVRLLLSYGADPMLATYAGLTPIALASEEATRELLQNHLADIQGTPRTPWFMYGPAACFDPKDSGYNILDDVPQADPVSEEEDIEFEVSDIALPNLYTLRGESPNDRWMLLQDLSNLLKIKSRDALLRQICGNLQASSSSSSSSVNHKSVLRELKMSDFLEQAHCCQFLNAGEKVNTRASKIALVKYTDKVKELLKVEKVLISLR